MHKRALTERPVRFMLSIYFQVFLTNYTFFVYHLWSTTRAELTGQNEQAEMDDFLHNPGDLADRSGPNASG